MSKPKIGITIGDINGVGPEVIIKTLSDNRILKYFTPVIYASSKVIAYHKNIVNDNFQFFSCQSINDIRNDRINVVNVWQGSVNITLGKVSEESGKVAKEVLEAGVQDLKENKIDILVTAPINKKAMEMAGFDHVGHTQYLAEKLEGSELMMMVNDDLRIGVVTDHIPLRRVHEKIKKGLIQKKIQLMEKSLKMDFGIEKPTIAVLGLNPHAGDDGRIGKEDSEIVRPAVLELKKQGKLVNGPFPADGFFGSGDYKKYDGIIAMYHDQGLIPFKLLSFGEGVNFTAGLSAIRTSPDHGTAMDIAGTNMADPGSFRKAIFAGLDIFKSRTAFFEDSENSLVKGKSNQPQKEYDESEDEVLERDEEPAE